MADGARLMVAFASGAVDRARLADVAADRFAPDEFVAGDREIYLWLPNGVSGSRIPIDFWDKQTGLMTTTRNWNTVTKLLATSMMYRCASSAFGNGRVRAMEPSVWKITATCGRPPLGGG